MQHILDIMKNKQEIRKYKAWYYNYDNDIYNIYTQFKISNYNITYSEFIMLAYICTNKNSKNERVLV